MEGGIDALGRMGRLTDAQSSKFADLAIQAAAAATGMRAVGIAADTSVQAEWENALATDKAREAYAAANAEMGKVPDVSGAATDGVLSLASAANQAASGFFSMSAGLFAAIRAAQEAEALNRLVPAWGVIAPGSIGVPVGAGSTGFRSGVTASVDRGVSNTVTVHVAGVWDPATAKQLARQVGQELVGLTGRKFAAV
jgi:hypothetical protein